MTSVGGYYFTELAADDLASIINYSDAVHGEAQTGRYLDTLHERLDNLTQLPGMGSSRDDLSEGVRSMPCGQHVIFYTIEPDQIRVIRILHKSRDIDAAIGG